MGSERAGQAPTGEGLGGCSMDFLLTPSETGKHGGSLIWPAPAYGQITLAGV